MAGREGSEGAVPNILVVDDEQAITDLVEVYLRNFITGPTL